MQISKRTLPRLRTSRCTSGRPHGARGRSSFSSLGRAVSLPLSAGCAQAGYTTCKLILTDQRYAKSRFPAMRSHRSGYKFKSWASSVKLHVLHDGPARKNRGQVSKVKRLSRGHKTHFTRPDKASRKFTTSQPSCS